MPISIEWDNDAHTILLHKYDGKWTLDDYDAAAAKARAMAVQAGRRVSYIIDITHTASPPLGIAARVMRATEARASNEGLTVMVGVQRNKLIWTLFENGMRLMPEMGSIIKLAATVEEARAILTGSDSEIL